MWLQINPMYSWFSDIETYFIDTDGLSIYVCEETIVMNFLEVFPNLPPPPLPPPPVRPPIFPSNFLVQKTSKHVNSSSQTHTISKNINSIDFSTTNCQVDRVQWKDDF